MKDTTSGLYILLEKQTSSNNDSIYGYDTMGYTHNEKDAIAWRDANLSNRTYKYCWNKCKDRNTI